MSLLRFDNIEIDSTAVGTDEFVSGSGRLSLVGEDAPPVTTSDGRIHHARRKVVPRLECELYGDKTALQSSTGLGVTVEVLRGVTSLKSFTAVVTAVYNESSRTTRITAAGDPADS